MLGGQTGRTGNDQRAVLDVLLKTSATKVTGGEIAAAADLDTEALDEILDDLVNRGWVTSTMIDSERSGRLRALRLTSAGVLLAGIELRSPRSAVPRRPRRTRR